jgi:LysM repeat protein
MSPQAHAATSAAPATTPSASFEDTTSQAGLSPAERVSLIHRLGKHASGSARSVTYTVRSGDSLSAIAKRVYHQQDAWPVIYWANHSQIRWANEIRVGQVLKVPAKPAKMPSAPSDLGPSAPAPVQAAAPANRAYAPVQATAAVVSPRYSNASYSGGTPGGSFGSCVVARESGGNSQVMNSSGHYGLYQFSASTWAAYGGSAAAFGNASVAQQNQVFANALAAGGQSNWSAYDGC